MFGPNNLMGALSPENDNKSITVSLLEHNKKAKVAQMLSRTLSQAIAGDKKITVAEAISNSVALGVSKALELNGAITASDAKNPNYVVTDKIQEFEATLKVEKKNQADDIYLDEELEEKCTYKNIEMFNSYLNNKISLCQPDLKSPFYNPTLYSKKKFLEYFHKIDPNFWSLPLFVTAAYYIDSYLVAKQKKLNAHELSGLMITSLYLAQTILEDCPFPESFFALFESRFLAADETKMESHNDLVDQKEKISCLVSKYFDTTPTDDKQEKKLRKEFLNCLPFYSKMDFVVKNASLIKDYKLRKTFLTEIGELKEGIDAHRKLAGKEIKRFNGMVKELWVTLSEKNINLYLATEQYNETLNKLETLKKLEMADFINKVSTIHFTICAKIRISDPKTVFCAPAIPLERYLHLLSQYAFASKSELLKAAILIDRYILQIPLDMNNVHNLWATALSFVLDGVPQDYHKLAGLPEENLAKMRQHFSEIIKDFTISDQEFNDYLVKFHHYNPTTEMAALMASVGANIVPVTPVFNKTLSKQG